MGKLLAPFPEARLKDAVLHYRETLKARAKSVTYLELFNRYLAFKQNCSQKYLKELRITRDRFPSLHPLLVCDITAHETLEPLLARCAPALATPRCAIGEPCSTTGSNAVTSSLNPVERLDFIASERREVEILELDEIARLLNDALDNDLPLLPFLVLGFFCGIRPEGELLKLEWRDIDWRGREVIIRPEVSKTKRRRFPKLSKNAIAWLNEYRLRGGTTEGKVVVWGKENLRHHRLANRARAGVTRWPHQGMRHSFCSYWLALHKDVNELVLQSGHDDPNTMWRHYHKGARRAEAVKFWTINPSHRAAA